MEFIAEIIILALFIYPGAMIRWVFTGCRRPLKDLLNDDGYMNGSIGLVVIVGGIAGILQLPGGKKDGNIPFVSFSQLSEGPPKQIVRALVLHPQVDTVTFHKLPQTDSLLYYKTWTLNDSLKIKHKAPSFYLRLFADNISDTLIIHGQYFPIEKIIKQSIVANVTKVYCYDHAGSSYLICSIRDAGTGRLRPHYLLVFNISDLNHVVCLNEQSGVDGMIWDVKDNLITDLDEDGIVEINILDSSCFRSCQLLPAALKKTDKVIYYIQTGQDKFCIDRRKSNWYFDIKGKPEDCGKRAFDFDGDTNWVYDRPIME